MTGDIAVVGDQVGNVYTGILSLYSQHILAVVCVRVCNNYNNYINDKDGREKCGKVKPEISISIWLQACTQLEINKETKVQYHRITSLHI